MNIIPPTPSSLVSQFPLPLWSLYLKTLRFPQTGVVVEVVEVVVVVVVVVLGVVVVVVVVVVGHGQ